MWKEDKEEEEEKDEREKDVGEEKEAPGASFVTTTLLRYWQLSLQATCLSSPPES